jgi:hypothetical protein
MVKSKMGRRKIRKQKRRSEGRDKRKVREKGKID